MKLSLLTIENYKSFGTAQTISFAYPSGKFGSGLTLLVGQNGTGKTTVFDSMRLLLTTSGIFDQNHRRGTLSPVIKLFGPAGLIRGAEADPNRRYGISYPGPGPIDNQNIRIVSSRRSWAPRFNSEGSYNEVSYWSQLNARRDASQHAELILRLRALEGSATENDRLTQVMKTLIPSFGKWGINYRDGSFLVEYCQAGDLWHQADALGDGMLNMFQLAVAILDTDEKAVLFVDEPELSLHPQAQKSLAAALKRVASSRQVVVASHSPHFIDFEIMGNGAEMHRFYLKGGETRVRSLSKTLVADLKSSMQDYQKPQLFDAVAKEMFFDDGVMFVEGQEDVGLFRRVARESGKRELPIFGYGMGGASFAKRFLQMATELDVRCALLLDGTEAERAIALRTEFPNAKIDVLPTEDIRDKDPQPEKSAKIGMFARSGLLKSEYQSVFLGMYDSFAEFFAVN